MKTAAGAGALGGLAGGSIGGGGFTAPKSFVSNLGTKIHLDLIWVEVVLLLPSHLEQVLEVGYLRQV